MDSIYLVIGAALAFGLGLSLYHAQICRSAIARYGKGGRC
jgi:hypothetical protein